MLSKKQQYAFDLAISGKSLFLTGDAGCGKSYLLQKIIDTLPPAVTFVTAWTGAAASKVGGSTYLSFMGIGLGDNTKEELLKKQGFMGRKNLKNAVTLIIDEVSMLNADIFDKSEWIARQVRENDEPFGGIQLILAGDFYQIPPVKSTRLLFESINWNTCIPQIVELDEIFRQSEPELIDLLNRIRHNKCTEETIATIESLKRDIVVDDGILPVEIYCTNADVMKVNNKRLAELEGEEVIFTSVDTGADMHLKDCIRPDILRLKVGAIVMYLENDRDDKTLVNGSQGIVESFHNGLPIVKFTESAKKLVDFTSWKKEVKGKILATRFQLPLTLSWSMTGHKVQGMSIARLKIKCDDAFEYGQPYVMFSRARTMAGLQVIGFDEKKFAVNPKVRRFYKKIRESALNN